MAFASAALLLGCSGPEAEPAPLARSVSSPLLYEKLAEAEQVIIRVGPLAESSFYACLFNAMAQGISLKQAQDDCATKLLEDDGKGFGGDGGPLGSFPGRNDDAFDPAKVVGACNAGDPKTGQSLGAQSYGKWGYASWGKEPGLEGLVKEDSMKLKDEAIAEAEAAAREFDAAVAKELALLKERKDAENAGNEAEAKRLEEERKKAYEDAQKALEKKKQKDDKAKADPNKSPPLVGRPADGDSTCSLVLAAARELLRECNRNGWKSYECQSLQAKMNHCPDPALIYVNPEEGYSCGEKIDAEAVKNAWVSECEKTVLYGPGGDNPCEPPVLEGSGRVIRTRAGEVCTNPLAHVDPEQAGCYGEIKADTFGQPDLQEIIFIGLTKLGGPIFVLPPPPPPRAGGDPRP